MDKLVIIDPSFGQGEITLKWGPGLVEHLRRIFDMGRGDVEACAYTTHSTTGNGKHATEFLLTNPNGRKTPIARLFHAVST